MLQFFLFLLFLPLALAATSTTPKPVDSLPEEPIYFHKPITNRRTFNDFLLSNANVGRADLFFCVVITPLVSITPPVDPEEFVLSGLNFDAVVEPLPTPLQRQFWSVGGCETNFSVAETVAEVTKAQKLLVLRVADVFPESWQLLHPRVKGKRFVFLQFAAVLGPGPDSLDAAPLKLPADLTGVAGVVLGFVEGGSSEDNADDRYWFYHFEQMAAHLAVPPLDVVPVKVVALNGLYLTRSTVQDIGNCSQATGFLHYLNPRDTVRLNVYSYRKRIELYKFLGRYNIWAISDFYSPNFLVDGAGRFRELPSSLWLALVFLAVCAGI